MVKSIKRNNNLQTFGNRDAVDFAILAALSIQLVRRRTQSLGFVYDAVKVLNTVRQLVQGSAGIVLSVPTDILPQLLLDVGIQRQMVSGGGESDHRGFMPSQQECHTLRDNFLICEFACSLDRELFMGC